MGTPAVYLSVSYSIGFKNKSVAVHYIFNNICITVQLHRRKQKQKMELNRKQWLLIYACKYKKKIKISIFLSIQNIQQVQDVMAHKNQLIRLSLINCFKKF